MLFCNDAVTVESVTEICYLNNPRVKSMSIYPIHHLIMPIESIDQFSILFQVQLSLKLHLNPNDLLQLRPIKLLAMELRKTLGSANDILNLSTIDIRLSEALVPCLINLRIVFAEKVLPDLLARGEGQVGVLEGHVDSRLVRRELVD